MKKNSLGLIAIKVGMTSLFSQGQRAVTVLKVDPNYVTQLKSVESDGYNAVQLTSGSKKPQRVTKPLKGHYKKALENSTASSPFGAILKEFRVDSIEKYSVGQALTCDLFSSIKKIDATGISKGKGFAGAMKRHNFKGQRASHGNSLSHRVHGSTGQNQSPGKVFKGKKMAGRMGNEQVTTQSMQILEVNVEKNYILVEGAVPGAPGGYVFIKPAVKSSEVV